MNNALTPEEATELLRMLAPVGGIKPAEPKPVERARQCRRLYDHLRHDGGHVPRWLKAEVHRVV